MAGFCLLTAFLTLAVPARAQDALTAAPDSGLTHLDPAVKPKDSKIPPPTLQGLALSMGFGGEVWEKIGVSTGAVPVEMDRLLQAGYYKLEIVQLILLAEKSGARLSELTVQRRKMKKSLRELTQAAGLDYDALYDQAVKTAERVSKREVSLMRVGVRGRAAE